jgi:hypothetical protein
MKLIRTAAVLSALALGGAGLHAQQRLPADSMELGRKYTTWFYTGMADSLLANMDSAFKARMTVDQIQEAMANVATRAGNEVTVVEEKFITRNGARQYWRAATMDILGEPFLLRWVITPEGKIAGVGMGLLSEAPPIDP